MEWIGQAIGIVAMAFNILSYQSKSARGVIAMQFFGASLFAASYLMIGAYVGGILNAIAAIRALLFYFKDKTKVDRVGWLPVFIGVYLLVYAATFLFVIKQPRPVDFAIEILPVIGMIFTTLAYRYSDAAIIRRLSTGSVVSWLIYNIISFSLGGIICEVISIASIIIGMLRLDRGKKNDQELYF